MNYNCRYYQTGATDEECDQQAVTNKLHKFITLTFGQQYQNDTPKLRKDLKK